MRIASLFFVLLIAVVSLSIQGVSVFAETPAIRSSFKKSAEKQITDGRLRAHIRFLADDLMEGRGPGTRGDKLAQKYIATQFQALGLQPGAPDGTWLQPFPLIGCRTKPPESITIRKNAGPALQLTNLKDYVFTSGKPVEAVSVRDAELVFVGYGMIAPEYDWNDFKDVDVRGKVLVIMNNDPSDDPELFAGKRRLYYGRWDYKYAMAAKMGAAGAIIIHTTPSAGYPYQVVQTSWSGEEFQLKDDPSPPMALRGWFHEDAARRVVEFSGHDLDQLRKSAESRDFRPVSLGVSLSCDMTCTVREQSTANVIGLLPGSDPDLKDEMVIFMAHHDHIGLAPERDERGDNIYNGAVDNASGVASLLTIASACCQAEDRPKRSLLFVCVGAEEQGLLGSKYFAQHPTVPAGFLAAVINIDGVNILGPTHDVNVIGYGKSSLDGVVAQIAQLQHRHVTPDHFPDRGYYYRSDQFSLAQVGVPGVYLHSGIDVIGKPPGWGKQRLDEWVETKYHQTSDEYDPSWDLGGAILDTKLLYLAGMVVADDDSMPAWNPGDEFEKARQRALESRRRLVPNRPNPK